MVEDLALGHGRDNPAPNDEPFFSLKGPEFPTSQVTFWGQLDADDKKTSVDTRESWAFGKKLAWDPAGRVKG